MMQSPRARPELLRIAARAGPGVRAFRPGRGALCPSFRPKRGCFSRSRTHESSGTGCLGGTSPGGVTEKGGSGGSPTARRISLSPGPKPRPRRRGRPPARAQGFEPRAPGWAAEGAELRSAPARVGQQSGACPGDAARRRRPEGSFVTGAGGRSSPAAARSRPGPLLPGHGHTTSGALGRPAEHRAGAPLLVAHLHHAAGEPLRCEVTA